MCGIAGFTGFDNNVRLAREANRIQRHRGPDNQSIWYDDRIALAHQRLSIIDLSDSANQPFVKHNLVLVFNGEIYNYKALQEKLQTEKGISFTTSSDTEVVLEMYRHYDALCLDYFIGMFAFAVYDNNTGSLFVARDHFGIKPVFFTEINSAFAFSSELKTLVTIPGFNKTINSKSLVSCLNYLWVSGNETMFNGCYKLPPAHYLTFTKQEGVRITKYWELDDTLSDRFENGRGDATAAEEIAAAVVSSVNRHMVADVPVSSFLSGGLDSSIIGVLAKRVNRELSTYTISTLLKDRKVEKMPDDEKYANRVAALYHFDHNVIKISPDIIREFPDMVRMLDEPIGDPAAINTYLICKAARQKGVKVLLSGMGADEIFFGYRRQKATLLAVQYNKLSGPVKGLTNKVVNLLPVRVLGQGFRLGRWAKRFMKFANLPLDQAYMRSYSYYDPDDLKNLLKGDYSAAIEAVKKEHQTLFDSKYKDDPVNRICNVDIQMFMLGLNLTYTDRASMAASVEVRVPFIDKLVVTKAMQVPGRLKIKKGISKYILKKAAEKFLPKEIIHRKKAAFGAPIRSWISNDLREMTDDLLSKEAINRRGFLNYDYVKNLIDNDRKGIDDNAYQIYQLLTLELWCKEYLDTCN